MNILQKMLLFLILMVSSSGSALAQNYQVTHFAAPDDSQLSYFINGLASAIPSVGYGLRNLSRSLHGRHYSYITPVEGTVPVQISVISDIQKKLKYKPNAKINLIGVSYGGNIVTLIAQQLNAFGIRVNYLAVIDAPAPVPITRNVHRVDNFYCRQIGCIGQKIFMAWGNKDTISQQFRVKSNHIAMSATPVVEERITGQLSEIAMNFAPEPLEKPENAIGFAE